MSNPPPIDIIIKSTMDPQGVNQADTALKQLQRTNDDTAVSTVNLAEKTGLNRREMSLAFGEVASLTGASPALIQGLEGLAHGFGVTAVAVVGFVEVAKMAQQAIKEHMAAEQEEARQLAQTDVSLDAYIGHTRELRIEQMLLTDVQDVLTKGVGQAGINFAIAAQNADAEAAAELRVGQFMRMHNDSLIEQDRQNIASAKSSLQYSDAVLKLAADFAPLNYAGKQWKELSAEQQAAMLALAQANGQYAALASTAANQTVTMTDDGLDNAKAVDQQAEALRRADIALNNVAGTAVPVVDAFGNISYITRLAADGLDTFTASAKRFNENQNMMSSTADPAALKKFTDADAVQQMIDKGSIAKQETDKAIANAQREAEALAKFQNLVAEASQVASPKIISNFQLIANSAGDASLKTAELHAYINSLPKDVKAKIELAIQFGGNMGLANQLGMGGGAQPASRDWMKELDATFAQQSGAIQQKFVQDAGGNKDQAINTWMQQHKMELLGAMQQDAGQFTNVQGPMADMQKGLMGQLGNTKMSDPLLQGVTKDTKGMQAVGDAMGAIIGKQAAQRVTDAMGDSASAISQALLQMLDGRYVKIQPYVAPS